jgi:predicted RND superfamily exporter protein
LSKDDPRLSLFVHAAEEFAINDLVMVVVKTDKGVFETQTLKNIKEFTEKLKEKKEIFMISSIGNIADIKKIEGGIEVKDLLDKVPQNEEELKKLSKYVLSKEAYKDNIVSSDGKTAAISIFISEKYDPIGIVQRVIIPESKKYFKNTGKIYYSGMPSDGYFLNLFTTKDLRTLTPMIVFLIILILSLSFKSFKGVVFPSVVVIFSVIWLFGFIGFLNKPLTLITPAIPVLLIALGSAYGIHVLNKYIHDVNGSDSETLKQTLIKATTEIFVPVALAGITTLIGFLSFTTANLTLISDFGIFSAVGIFFALVIAITLIPTLSSFSDFKESQDTDKGKFSKYLDRFGDIIIKNKWLVFILSIGFLSIFSIGILRVNREVNFSEYYPKNSQPRKGLKIAGKEFNGAYPVLFYFKSHNSKSPEILRIMRRGEDFLFSDDNLSSPYSIVEIIEDLNNNLNERFSIPDKENAIGNLWFFMEGRDEIKQIISGDNRDSIVYSKTSEASTGFNKKLFYKIDKFLKDDLRKKYYKYDLSKYNYEKSIPIRIKEGKYLTDEIVWLEKHYLGKSTEKRKIFNIIAEGVKIKIPENNIKNRLESLLSNYILSDDFDFEINEKSGKNIINDIVYMFEKGEFDKKNIIDIFAKKISKKEYDRETAQDIADTVIYRLDRIKKELRTEAIWASLNNIFKTDSKSFRKRVLSLLYDVNDDIAVIHAPEVKGIKGENVSLEFVDQSGQPSLLTSLDESLFSSQIQSLVLAYFVTLFLMIFMRKNFILGIISTFPIIFTIGVMYGFLGYTGISLDYATMMIGGISIGVGIDYAIHFIHGVTLEVDNGLKLEEAVGKSFKEKGRAIITNSVAVMFGFAVLLFSSILPLKNFGGTMVAAMFLSALATLTLLPSSLLILKPKFKKEKGGKK